MMRRLGAFRMVMSFCFSSMDTSRTGTSTIMSTALVIMLAVRVPAFVMGL